MDSRKIVMLTLIDILLIFISAVLGNYWYKNYSEPESFVIGNVIIDEYKPYEDTNILDYVSSEDILFSANINKARFSSVDGTSTYEYNFEHIDFNGEENNYGIYVGDLLLSNLTQTAGTVSGTHILKFYDVEKQVLCECDIQVAFSSYTNKTTMRVTLAEEDLGYLMKHFASNDFVITFVKNPFDIGINIGKIDENVSSLTIIDDGIETTIIEEIGTKYTLPRPRLIDFEFLGWELSTGDGLVEGTTFTFGETNTTIVAKYDICDISFNSVKSGVSVYLGDSISIGNPLNAGDSLRMTKSGSITLTCGVPLFNKPYLTNISTDAVKYSILTKDSASVVLSWSGATYFNCDISSVHKNTDVDVSVGKTLGSVSGSQLRFDVLTEAPIDVVAEYSDVDNGVVATYTLDEFETESDVVNMTYYVNDTAIDCELTAVETYSIDSTKTWICAEVSVGPYTLRDIVLTNNTLSLVIDCDEELISNHYALESTLLYSLSAEDNNGIYPYVAPVATSILTINYQNLGEDVVIEGNVGDTYELDTSLLVDSSTFTNWKIVSGDGTLDGNTFTFGSENTVISAVYSNIYVNTYSVTELPINLYVRYGSVTRSVSSEEYQYGVTLSESLNIKLLSTDGFNYYVGFSKVETDGTYIVNTLMTTSYLKQGFELILTNATYVDIYYEYIAYPEYMSSESFTMSYMIDPDASIYHGRNAYFSSSARYSTIDGYNTAVIEKTDIWYYDRSAGTLLWNIKGISAEDLSTLNTNGFVITYTIDAVEYTDTINADNVRCDPDVGLESPWFDCSISNLDGYITITNMGCFGSHAITIESISSVDGSISYEC